MNYISQLPTPKYGNSIPIKTVGKKKYLKHSLTGAIQSKGAFKIVDKATGNTIGSTRFYDYNDLENSIFIGYTFYTIEYWGKGINYSVKVTMLDYIFQFVSKVYFHIGADNIRSQIAIGRLGAKKITEQEVIYYGETPKLNYVYEISKEKWQKLNNKQQKNK